MSSEKIHRPRRRVAFRFSLRSLLIAITLLCVGLSWWMYRARRQAAAVKGIQACGGWVYYDYQHYDSKNSISDFAADSPIPKWLIEGLGVDFFHHVDVVSMVYAYENGGKTRRDNPNVDANIASYLAGFPYLRGLFVNEQQLTNDGFREVAKLKYLEEFYFWYARDITDEGVSQLRHMPRLRSVHLSESHLSDRGLAALASSPHMAYLSLQFNDVTDEGIRSLRASKTIETLWIGGSFQHPSKISDASGPIFASMPKLKVLELGASEVTLDGLKPLQNHPRLSEIILYASKADDKKRVESLLPGVKVGATLKP